MAVGWLLYEAPERLDRAAAPGRGVPARVRARLRGRLRDGAEPVRGQRGDRRPPGQSPRRLPAHPRPATCTAPTRPAQLWRSRLWRAEPWDTTDCPPFDGDAAAGAADRGRRSPDWLRERPERAPCPGQAAQRAGGPGGPARRDRGRRARRGAAVDRRGDPAAADPAALDVSFKVFCVEPDAGRPADRRRAGGTEPAVRSGPGGCRLSSWTPNGCASRRRRDQRASRVLGRAAGRRGRPL